MRAQITIWQFGRSVCATTNQALILAVLVVLIVSRSPARADATEAVSILQPANVAIDPFGPVDAGSDPFETVTSDSPVDPAAYVPQRTLSEIKPVNFQAPPPEAEQPALNAPSQPVPNTKTPRDPCAAAVFKPLNELGIGIAQPAGQMPTDHATACWEQVTQTPGSLGVCRCWPTLCYQWDATCFCHQPLYFEEINAERYGYVCGDCGCCCECVLQPAASAAHFFGTVTCLPYCIAAEPVGECVYTLGHYRPGSSPPLRWHWPPYDPWAALTAGGVYTGLIFAIP